MEPNYVLSEIFPDASHASSSALSYHVHGETQDEDGDWATDFILADPLPPPISSLPPSPPSDEMLVHQYLHFPSEADPSFICQVCSSYVPLDMLGPEIQCGCLCCARCLRRHIDNHFPSDSWQGMLDAFHCPCPSCYRDASVSSSVIRSLSPEAFRLLEEKANQSFFRSANYVLCPGCNVMVEKVPGDIPAGLAPSGVPEFDKTMSFIELDDNGKPMSRDALLHKYYNYFKCSMCRAGFCGLCMKIPYHLGYTCDDYEEFRNSDKCIYCETLIPNKSSPDERVKSMTNKALVKLLNEEGLDTTWCVEKKDFLSVWKLSFSVCGAEDCRKQLRNACTRVLLCGHRCGGLTSERTCLPCLEDGCREKSHLPEWLPSADDWCPVCMVEALRAAPAVQLKCGHVVHFECAKRKIEEGFPGPEITFGYLKCPQCSQCMEHDSLARYLEKPFKLLDLVKESALKRAQMEKLNPYMGTRELTDYALKKYNFYLCSKCQNPYYGGNRECGANLRREDDAGRNQYDQLELVCGGCSAASIDGMGCVKGHGKKYLEFKCRFCCTVATYFCFGSMHFCNRCHETRPDGNPNYVPPFCGGPNTCPLKVSHAPNGEESCLGCSMCRILSQ